jgi:branched-chain amino acid transport system permease protein
MVNFAQGELMMLGAFVAITFVDVLGMAFLPGVLAAMATMGVIGVLLERLLLRPMIGEPHFAVLMLTIGLGFILRAVAGAIWGSSPRPLGVPYAGQVISVGELVVSIESLAIVAGTVFLCAALYAFFRFTRLGIAMQAASQNQLAAYYVGIPVKRIYGLVWALSAVVATVAGVLAAPVTLVDPLMGFIGIKAFAAAIVGGFGSLPGAIIGGLLVGLAEQFAGLYLPPGMADMSAYVILLAMLILRPQGLIASMQRKKV